MPRVTLFLALVVGCEGVGIRFPVVHMLSFLLVCDEFFIPLSIVTTITGNNYCLKRNLFFSF